MEHQDQIQEQVLREYRIPADDFLAIGVPTRWLRIRDRRRIKTLQLIEAANGDLILRKKQPA